MVMTPRQKEKQDLLDRIHDLVEEANRLPRSRASWDRRELIEWQLLLLFRRVANLSAGPRPYWSDPDLEQPRDDSSSITGIQEQEG